MKIRGSAARSWSGPGTAARWRPGTATRRRGAASRSQFSEPRPSEERAWRAPWGKGHLCVTAPIAAVPQYVHACPTAVRGSVWAGAFFPVIAQAWPGVQRHLCATVLSPCIAMARQPSHAGPAAVCGSVWAGAFFLVIAQVWREVQRHQYATALSPSFGRIPTPAWSGRPTADRAGAFFLVTGKSRWEVRRARSAGRAQNHFATCRTMPGGPSTRPGVNLGWAGETSGVAVPAGTKGASA